MPTLSGGASTPPSDVAYDEGTWNANTDAPTKNAVRDKIETLAPLISPAFTTPDIGAATADSVTGKTSGLALNAGGTNQSITLTPSGTGVLSIKPGQINQQSILFYSDSYGIGMDSGGVTHWSPSGQPIRFKGSSGGGYGGPFMVSLGIDTTLGGSVQLADGLGNPSDVALTRASANTFGITNNSSTTYATIGAGGLQFPTDNTYDIGASGSMPRDIYSARNVNVAGAINVTGAVNIGGAFTRLTSSVDGVLKLADISNADFSRLQLGGTTSSFPAIKRNGTGIDIKLADDSAYADLTALGVGVAGQPPATMGVSASGSSLVLRGADIYLQSTSGGATFALFDSNGMTVGTGGSPVTLIKTATATLDFGSTVAGTTTDLTITLAGAAVGDSISLGVPNGSVVANGSYSTWVSAADTVTVRFTNSNLVTTVDPASGTFRVTLLQF